VTRAWDDWQPDEWPTERTELAWTPQTPCPFQERGLTCPNGGVHRLSTTWQDCFLRFVLGEYYATNNGSPDAPPPPSLDVTATDGGGSPRPAGRATRRQAAPVRAGLAGLRDRAQKVLDPDRGTTAERIGRRLRTWWQTRRAAAQPVHRTGDQAQPDTRTEPVTYDPGPTYGWGAGHTGRNWRRWL
jgi:hypothetical protein